MMVNDVVLSRSEFEHLQQGVEQLRASIEELVVVGTESGMPGLYAALSGLDSALSRPRRSVEQLDQAASEAEQYWLGVKGQIGALAFWNPSLGGVGGRDRHGYPGARSVIYEGRERALMFSSKIEGQSWVDLYRACDRVIRNSGDLERLHVHGFLMLDEGVTLELQTGLYPAGR